MNPIKSLIIDPIKAAALHVAKQAGLFRDLAIAKANKQPKKVKRMKQAYVPGSLGVSAVSEAIQADYGLILNRRERKQLAKAQQKPFKIYMNGGN
ncbi:hypothetical protein E0485_14600 [Paenibacillus albiflavus]|uniref:Uncharacterized protein n=1 Tax=Paenibacillus albiflavus TaxID=2545760 RepID=A0A4R4EAF7_9BACL|nr:hypothetical protein [Paenibacillus albiflavus]TCZ76073.1 hypothetical protein E0485_14600 [Paenibacillus albiflavus]